jgi:hypothetical protein
MTIRLRTSDRSAVAEAWDPADPAPFISFAGPQFLRREGVDAIVLDRAGFEDRIHPGWLAFRIDGDESGAVQFLASANVGSGSSCTWNAAVRA